MQRLNAAAFAPEALPSSLKLRRTAGVPNAAAALGWPAVALAEAGRRASPKLGENHAERRRELAERAEQSSGIFFSAVSAVSALNVICSAGLFHRNRDAVAYWHDRSHQPRMTTQTLVVFRDGARVFRLARRLRDESWHHLAVPQHVVGDDEPARPHEIDEAVEHRQVRALVAVLKDQIEWAAHFRQHQRRVADHDGDAGGDARPHEVLARSR